MVTDSVLQVWVMVGMIHYELLYIVNGVEYDLILYCITERNSGTITRSH